MMQSKLSLNKGNPLWLGANVYNRQYHFGINIGEKEGATELEFYDINGNKILNINLQEYSFGGCFAVFVGNLPKEVKAYGYTVNGKGIVDYYGKALLKGEAHKYLLPEGINKDEAFYKAHSFKDLILYKLHTKGFTKDIKSFQSMAGTFRGLVKKIDYFKELGINGLMLMPSYDFAEKNNTLSFVTKKVNGLPNYWGYCAGNYFIPKQSYLYSSSNKDFKAFVKTCHKNEIDVYMEFYFPENTNKALIQDILAYWHYNYGVDGFHLIGSGVLISDFVKNGYFKNCKIFFDNLNYLDNLENNMANIGNEFSLAMKKFLKSDENSMEEAIYYLRRENKNFNYVNWITSQDGFTLNDLVSYNYKHNEANGEGNKDGAENNLSWNCGAEGDTKKKYILSLRKRQIKNAFMLLMLSQGTPMLYAGDEFCNSQKGNNNAYCQDNEVSWLNWKNLQKNREIFNFVKFLIEFRKKNSFITHSTDNKQLISYNKEYPNISYHGEKAWFFQKNSSTRTVGICYHNNKNIEAPYIYVGYNFYWEKENLALPRLPEGYIWKKIVDTYNKNDDGNNFGDFNEKYEDKFSINARTVIMLIGVKED